MNYLNQKKGFLGGALANAAMSGMASTIQAKGGCCPICPNLQTILKKYIETIKKQVEDSVAIFF